MSQLVHAMIANALLLTTWNVFLKRLYYGKQKVRYDSVGISVSLGMLFLFL